MTTPAPTGLIRRAADLVDEHFRHLVIPQYFSLGTSSAADRGRPLPYLKVVTTLVREFGLKTIVEIGTMRHPMIHGLDEYDPKCCIEGHSTLFWADTGAEVFTVDVSARCAEILVGATRTFRNLHVYTADGIWFLKRFEQPIDLLYLDAWDLVPGLDYAEKHLEAYVAAQPRLSKTCVILIDDTDILNGGKGRLVIPRLIRDGFELITWGRQALLVREQS